MKKVVELPIVKPIYSTYHFQGNSSAILYSNPSIKNWFLNDVMILCCNRKFLKGYSSPEINVELSAPGKNPYLCTKYIPMQFIKGHIHFVIRNMIDEGYYVSFWGIDDYYIEGKTWYKERHFEHDGMICGYDQIKKTYSIYAYDKNWVYRVFKTPQSAFEKGRKSVFKNGRYGSIFGLKPTKDDVKLDPVHICLRLKDYLNEENESSDSNTVYGIIVHDYINMYIDKLDNGSIPYERMDKRVMRMIWEHKVVMLERIEAVEKSLNLNNISSKEYEKVVSMADNVRMMYASHSIKRRDSVLSNIKKNLSDITNIEKKVLSSFIELVEGVVKK